MKHRFIILYVCGGHELFAQVVHRTAWSSDEQDVRR